jgi:hypothetical protein
MIYIGKYYYLLPWCGAALAHLDHMLSEQVDHLGAEL